MFNTIEKWTQNSYRLGARFSDRLASKFIGGALDLVAGTGFAYIGASVFLSGAIGFTGSALFAAGSFVAGVVAVAPAAMVAMGAFAGIAAIYGGIAVAGAALAALGLGFLKGFGQKTGILKAESVVKAPAPEVAVKNAAANKILKGADNELANSFAGPAAKNDNTAPLLKTVSKNTAAPKA